MSQTFRQYEHVSGTLNHEILKLDSKHWVFSFIGDVQVDVNRKRYQTTM